MASFPPLKNYILFCMDRMIEQYGLKPPFLDVGCGLGEVSKYLSHKGWVGKAIDVSRVAISEAERMLQTVPHVTVKHQSLFEEDRTYNTIVALDVLEHLEDDDRAIRAIESVLRPSGYFIAAVPTHRREWRWDDDYFGHERRYEIEELKKKMSSAGLIVKEVWDFTFPVFWLMRRLYTFFKKPPKEMASAEKAHLAEICPTIKAWSIPLISDLLAKDNFFWRLLYRWQFHFFRSRVSQGHEMILLAQKH